MGNYTREKNIIKKDFKTRSEYFKAGLEQKNLNQGIFKNAYKENNQDNTLILSKDESKLLCEAFFNYKISSSLMLSSGNPNYSYKITECNFEYFNEGKINGIMFSFHIYSIAHDFWQEYKLFDFDSEYVYGIEHPCYNCLTVKNFMTNFI